MNDIFYTADIHLGHKNIIRLDERPFSHIEEMNEVLIDNINNRVGTRDILKIVGDVSFTIGPEEIRKHLLRIKCKNIILIEGNHDDVIIKNFHSHFLGIFKEVHEMERVKKDKNWITSCHFPMISWMGKNNGGINVYGHVHTKDENLLDPTKKRWNAYNAGMPVCNYFPVTMEELQKEHGYDKYYYRDYMERTGYHY